jgi:hypothetical protein
MNKENGESGEGGTGSNLFFSLLSLLIKRSFGLERGPELPQGRGYEQRERRERRGKQEASPKKHPHPSLSGERWGCHGEIP